MMSDQTKIGRELRAIMSGRAAVERDNMMRRCADKLLYWQQLAQRYHGVGLSKKELNEFWRELHDKRTNVELILEISVRSDDWKQVSQEVKAFIDEITYEMLLSQGAEQMRLEAAEEYSENVINLEENDGNSLKSKYKKQFKKMLAAKYGLGERMKLVSQLSELLAKAQLRQDAGGEGQKLSDPASLLEYINGYIEALEDEATSRKTLASGRVLLAGH